LADFRAGTRKNGGPARTAKPRRPPVQYNVPALWPGPPSTRRRPRYCDAGFSSDHRPCSTWSLGGELECQALSVTWKSQTPGQSQQPPGRRRPCRHSSPRRSPDAPTPAGVDEVVQSPPRSRTPRRPETSWPRSPGRPDFGHLHVGHGLGLVVDAETLAGATPGNQNLHAEVAEGGVTGADSTALRADGAASVDPRRARPAAAFGAPRPDPSTCLLRVQ